jgi:hypothetical protein
MIRDFVLAITARSLSQATAQRRPGFQLNRAGDLPLPFLLRQIGVRHDRIAAYQSV